MNQFFKPYQGVIFDLDGTLLNTIEDIAYAVNSVLEEKGWAPRPLTEYQYLVGAGLDQLLGDILGEKAADTDFYEAFKTRVRSVYSENWHQKSHPYNGIPHLLTQLQAHNVPRAVLSNKYHYGTQKIVEHFFDEWELHPVMGARDGMPLKPDPTAVLDIARQLDHPPEKLIYVGDTASDIQTAIRAGMLPLGVQWGFRPEEELVQAGAKAILTSPSEILTYFK